MMKKLTVAVLTALSLACVKQAERVERSSNPAVNVELLFEHDGCRVYRFWDRGRALYFTTCRGSIQWEQSNGKISQHVEVPTSK